MTNGDDELVEITNVNGDRVHITRGERRAQRRLWNWGLVLSALPLTVFFIWLAIAGH
jgi:hypothetical protein